MHIVLTAGVSKPLVSPHYLTTDTSLTTNFRHHQHFNIFRVYTKLFMVTVYVKDKEKDMSVDNYHITSLAQLIVRALPGCGSNHSIMLLYNASK